MAVPYRVIVLCTAFIYWRSTFKDTVKKMPLFPQNNRGKIYFG